MVHNRRALSRPQRDRHGSLRIGASGREVGNDAAMLDSAGALLAICATSLLALWVAASLAATLLTAAVLRAAAHRPKPPPNQPPCVVLVPVKGCSPNLPAFVDALMAQDYRPFRVVFVVESERDPAYPVLAEAAHAASERATLVVAGIAADRGQKVHNLAIALETLDGRDAIVAFTDADLLLPPDWLTQLTRPIARGTTELTTSYTILTPRSARPATLAASLISLGIATCPSPAGRHLVSGCATAIRRETLAALRPSRYLANTISDDLSLSRAARDAGIGVRHVLAARAPTPVEYGWRDLRAYGGRQYRILRLYAPAHWWFAAAALLLPVAGTATAVALAAAGDEAALLGPATVWLLQQGRFVLRRRIAERLFDATTFRTLAPAFRVQHVVGPLVHLAHAALFLGSAFGNTVRWAGITYRVTRGRVAIVERAASDFG
jgi:cellulose synthase/poly-beta-1,6-N-acetylglucosamine synthase-like glycosyltransferase